MTAVSFPFRNSDFAFASAKALHHGAVNCETSETVCSPDGAFDLGDIDLPMGDIDPWGDWDCRDWLKFPVDAVTLLESFGSKNYINADLRKAA